MLTDSPTSLALQTFVHSFPSPPPKPEFLYPSALARWGHLLLVRMSSNRKKNKGEPHSTTLPQRFELIPGRLYVHPIPQLLDNLGYLVVSCRPTAAPPVAFFVDCGDASSAAAQIQAISELHYHKQEIEVHAILSTHKHHDHTAGNRGLLTHRRIGQHLQTVVGGAVERVPCCNLQVADGDLLDLPATHGNDMNEVAIVEVVAVPSHTRGSVAFQLRCRDNSNRGGPFLFTGDAMFSGGAGVPFEADLDKDGDSKRSKRVNDPVRPGGGENAIVRCFAELLVRSYHHDMPTTLLSSSSSSPPSSLISPSSLEGIVVFPGHEYSTDLLNRQMQGTTHDATTAWTKLPPDVFFQTASQFYSALHKRSIPHGKLLVVPTPLSLELKINPHFRQMRKYGTEIVRAVRSWYRLFSRGTIPEQKDGRNNSVIQVRAGRVRDSVLSDSAQSDTPSTQDQWNVSVQDLSRSTFTTVYTSDLDNVIEGLARGKMSPTEAATELSKIKKGLEEPVIGRRPIPSTLPTEKVMYKVTLALAMLGSRPWGMTKADGEAMKLPPPLAPRMTNSIRVSKSRIVVLLGVLGAYTNEQEQWEVHQMIDLLWKEAAEYGINMSKSGPKNQENKNDDQESGTKETDIIELGVLKWMLFGVELRNPSWFSRFCMPCKSSKPPVSPDHPVATLDFRRTNGELVRHDPLTNPLCRNGLGNPDVSNDAEMEEEGTDEDRIEMEDNGEDDEEEREDDHGNNHTNGSGNREGMSAGVAVGKPQPESSTIQLQFASPSVSVPRRRLSDIPFDEAESVELEMIH